MPKPNALGFSHTPPALSLSDAQLATIMRLAEPLMPSCRDALLRILAHELRGRHDVGDGEVHRIVRTIIREAKWNRGKRSCSALPDMVFAIVAIWSKLISSWLFKPRLVVGQGEFSGTVGIHANGKDARYYLVPVTNPTRFPAAHEVELVLTRIEKSGQKGPEILFDEIMPLSWVRQELYRLLTRTVGTKAISALFYVQDDGVLNFTPALTPRGEQPIHFPRDLRGPIILWVTVRAVSRSKQIVFRCG